MSNCKLGEVSILGHTYTIHADDELASRELEGLMLPDEQVIVVRTGLRESAFSEALLHEIVEAIVEIAKIEDVEHSTIQILGIGLQQALSSLGISLPKIMNLVKPEPAPGAPTESTPPTMTGAPN